MGFSVTGSHVVIFIASIIAAGAVSGVILAVTYGINSSLSESGQRVQDLLDTDFVVINDPDNIPSSGGNHLFYIKNIGSNQLITSNETFNVFIDGELVIIQDYNFSPLKIKHGEIAILYINSSLLSAGDHSMRIIGPLTVEDEFLFTIS